METVTKCAQCAQVLTEDESLCDLCFQTLPMGEWVTVEQKSGLKS